MIEALFLDRDGVMNEVVFRGEVVGSPRLASELFIRDDFKRFYQLLSSFNLPLFVVSNQPDIRRGLMRQETLDAMTESILAEYPKLKFYYCTHDDRDHCHCRKPKTGLLDRVVQDFSLNPMRSLMIGDSDRDIEAGRRAHMKTALLMAPYNRQNRSQPDFEIAFLVDAVSLILEEDSCLKRG